MGYRSEVGFVIAKKEGRVVPDFNNIDPEFTFDIAKETDEAVLYCCDQIKWCDGNDEYPLVAEVSRYLDELDSSGNEDSYLFIRLGEDADDNEMRGSYWDNPFNFGYERRLVSTEH